MTHESGVSSGEEHQLVEVCVPGRIGPAGHQSRACRVITAFEVVKAEENVKGRRPSVRANPSNSASLSWLGVVREPNRDSMAESSEMNSDFNDKAFTPSELLTLLEPRAPVVLRVSGTEADTH